MTESRQPAIPVETPSLKPAATSPRRLCTVYRSPRIADMYLYVDLKEDLQRVPESLLQRFGTPQLVLKLALHPGRRLARADTGKVLAALDESGYYLQMPPPPDADMPELRRD